MIQFLDAPVVKDSYLNILFQAMVDVLETLLVLIVIMVSNKLKMSGWQVWGLAGMLCVCMNKKLKSNS